MKLTIGLLSRIHALVLVSSLSMFTHAGYSQKRDSTLMLKGAVSVTQNGFSFIPSFSLGKPAAILDLAVGKGRLSFEPQFRFALEGRPWSFIFIYRYKLIRTDKIQFTLGAHIPAINFVTRDVVTNGVTQNVIISQRFLAGELNPMYYLSKDVSVGMFYLYGHGFQSDAAQNTQLFSVRSSFSNVKLTGPFYMKFNPQVYYLKSDDTGGYYVSYLLTLAVQDFPLSVSHILNKAIESDVVAKDLDWNVSLIYSFGKDYVLK